MNIIGITNNDLSGASLISGGVIKAAVSEERFNNIKDFNGWPNKSIEFVTSGCGLSIHDIDHVCYGWSAGFSAERHLVLYLERHMLAKARGAAEESQFQERVSAELQNDIRARSEFDHWVDANNLKAKVAYIDHHEAHAVGAFALSPFASGLAVSCDGRGDFQSLAIFAVENGEVRCLYRQSTMDSYGYLYGRITKVLGFQPNRHEGKILGLAALGSPSGALDEIRDVVQFHDGRISFKLGGIYAPFYDRHFDEITLFSKRYSREDIAYALQEVLVETVTRLIDHYLVKTGLSNVAVAGGVFTNVRLNQHISELPNVANLFVLPCMGDGGLPIAASAAFCIQNKLERPKLASMALGPQCSNAELASRLTYDLPSGLTSMSAEADELLKQALRILEAGGIVGLFRGRSEFGPRALCNRTLLALPSIVGISATLNRRLQRSDFMPFAPVMGADFASRSLNGWTDSDLNSRYMTQTFDCTDDFKSSCPEVVHVDGTARPQIVWNETDPFMHRLLLAVHERTGSLSLINTSFNVHERPIVGDIRTAIDTVRDGVCDLLIVNDLYAVSPRSSAHSSVKEA